MAQSGADAARLTAILPLVGDYVLYVRITIVHLCQLCRGWGLSNTNVQFRENEMPVQVLDLNS